MKATDIERARDLLAEIDIATRLGVKLTKGERLRLTVGKGGDEAEVVLSTGFSDELRQRLIDALRAKVNVARDEAGRLGVEL